jgi:hypothetical protein
MFPLFILSPVEMKKLTELEKLQLQNTSRDVTVKMMPPNDLYKDEASCMAPLLQVITFKHLLKIRNQQLNLLKLHYTFVCIIQSC